MSLNLSLNMNCSCLFLKLWFWILGNKLFVYLCQSPISQSLTAFMRLLPDWCVFLQAGCLLSPPHMNNILQDTPFQPVPVLILSHSPCRKDLSRPWHFLMCYSLMAYINRFLSAISFFNAKNQQSYVSAFPFSDFQRLQRSKASHSECFFPRGVSV